MVARFARWTAALVVTTLLGLAPAAAAVAGYHDF